MLKMSFKIQTIWSVFFILTKSNSSHFHDLQKRGAKIYAEFLGGSFTCDAYHMTDPHPDGIKIEPSLLYFWLVELYYKFILIATVFFPIKKKCKKSSWKTDLLNYLVCVFEPNYLFLYA